MTHGKRTRVMEGGVTPQYLQRLRYPGLGGLINLGLSDTSAPRLAELAEAEAQILLVGVILDLSR